MSASPLSCPCTRRPSKSPGHQDLSPLQPAQAVRDAEERAAVAQPDQEPAARRDVHRAGRHQPHGAERADARRHRPQRIREEHAAEAGRRASPSRRAARVRVDGRISALIELGAGFHPEISGRENVFINGIMLGLTKREVARALRRDRRVRRDEGVHRRAGQDLLVRHVHAPRDSPSRSTSIPTCCSSTKCSRSATRASRTSASTSSPSSSAAARRSCS